MEYLSDKSSVAKMDKNLEKISPFELKNRLIEMADESVKKMAHVMLNAGRGNPNWIATEAREAFFILGSFAIAESRRVMDMSEGIAGIPQKEGIAQRFELWLKTHEGEPGIGLLKRTYNYMLMEHAVDPDSLVHEWAESMAGNQYPMPDRILKYTEILVRDYLNREMCDGRPPQGNFDLFATEGGTAGMCYVFDSLEENFLLHRGDSIALMVPAFTPYIEIPELTRYDYDVLNISADTIDENGLHTWQYKVEDINKLRDPKYKALFVINPSNPPSYELNKECVDAIKDVVNRWNPNLMIITDDGKFAHNILSPKKHIKKRYNVTIDIPVTKEMITGFERGIQLNDGECKKASLEITGEYTADVTITEGRYHQIKRMFGCYGAKVIELNRVQMGEFILPSNLKLGQCREITVKEIEQIIKK